MSNRAFLAAAAVAVCAAASADGAFEIVAVGKPRAEVVLAKSPEESSRLAAAEITNYVFRATGAALKIREDGIGKRGQGKIVVGTLGTLGDAVPAGIRSALEGSSRLEASWLGVRDGVLWIVGREEVAELYATYHFLESKLGVRWFKAATKEDPGDYVPPRRRTLSLKAWQELREPAFPERRLDMCGAATQTPACNSQACSVRNGYQIECAHVWHPREKVKFEGLYEFFAPRVARRRVDLGGGHLIFAQVWPPDDKHFAEHPEYFALVDGKRVKGLQYCYSNTNLLNLAACRTIRKLGETGGLGQYCYALWDTSSGACQCEKCVAMATPEETKRGIESTRFHKFVNFMSDRIYAAWPNANLLYLAYWTYRRPPVGVPHDPRMPVQLCLHERCYGHDFCDPSCARNAARLAEMKEWTKIAPYLFTYEYFSATPSLYACNELTHARDLKFYKSLGLVGWKEEALFSDACFTGGAAKPENIQACRDRMTSNWQRYYVCGHLSWDIGLDERRLLDDAESLYYGAAYPAMKRYHAIRRRLWDNNRNCLGFPTGDQRTATLLNAGGAKDELLALLDEAERLAAADAVRLSRVRLDRRWLADYWIKPNEALRAKAGTTMRASIASRPPVLDGSGEDGVWASAAYAEDFKTPKGFGGEVGKLIPPELATSVGVVADADSFYFLVTAKEPQTGRMKLSKGRDLNIWGDDAIELFLYPPAMDNRYYHIAVNALGGVYDARCPGNEAAHDLGVVAKGRIHADRYVIEMKVPAAGMHPIKEGETWRFLVARNRKVRDGLTPKGGGWSLGGGGYHDVLSYRSLVLGAKNWILNGSFDELDGKGEPKAWALTGKRARIEDVGGNKVLRLTGDVCYQYMFGRKQEARRISYTFRAKGAGILKTFFYSFTDTPNARAKCGYDRKFNKNRDGGRFALSSEWNSFTAEFEIPANETVGLAFCLAGKGGEAMVDDVFVSLLH